MRIHDHAQLGLPVAAPATVPLNRVNEAVTALTRSVRAAQNPMTTDVSALRGIASVAALRVNTSMFGGWALTFHTKAGFSDDAVRQAVTYLLARDGFADVPFSLNGEQVNAI